MPSADRRFRGVFDDVADLYDKARPEYPPGVFDDIARLGGLAPGSQVLEIGCGTGQATVPLASAGYEVVGVELGEHLAAIARRKLKSFPQVRIHVGAFEERPLQERSFDLVTAATAFHWIDSEVRLHKVAASLRPGGSLALIDTRHVAGGTNDFFIAVQECYRRWDPTVLGDFHTPSIHEVPDDDNGIGESELFGPVTLLRYVREVAYSADEYINLLGTFSSERHLHSADRKGLHDDIRSLIMSGFGGRVTKAYLTELRLARVLH